MVTYRCSVARAGLSLVRDRCSADSYLFTSPENDDERSCDSATCPTDGKRAPDRPCRQVTRLPVTRRPHKRSTRALPPISSFPSRRRPRAPGRGAVSGRFPRPRMQCRSLAARPGTREFRPENPHFQETAIVSGEKMRSVRVRPSSAAWSGIRCHSATVGDPDVSTGHRRRRRRHERVYSLSRAIVAGSVSRAIASEEKPRQHVGHRRGVVRGSSGCLTISAWQ